MQEIRSYVPIIPEERRAEEASSPFLHPPFRLTGKGLDESSSFYVRAMFYAWFSKPIPSRLTDNVTTESQCEYSLT